MSEVHIIKSLSENELNVRTRPDGQVERSVVAKHGRMLPNLTKNGTCLKQALTEVCLRRHAQCQYNRSTKGEVSQNNRII